jgi:hypothetical protein
MLSTLLARTWERVLGDARHLGPLSMQKRWSDQERPSCCEGSFAELVEDDTIKLSNELVEAADEKVLTKSIARYGRLDLLCIDELDYM